jgi:hypothetical protein
MSTAPAPTEFAAPPGLPDPVAPLGAAAAPAVRTTAVVVGVAGLALLIGAITDRRQFFHSYLFGYVFALSVTLGALFWVLIHHVADAGWSVGLRRTFENVTLAILPLAVLDVPVLIGIMTGNLHEWWGFINGPQPEGERGHLWHVRHTWFALPFFLARNVLYFGVWLAYATMMRRWSVRQDTVGGADLSKRMHWYAPSGVILLALTSTFFAFDVLMSLQYSWFSTIFGVYFWTGGIRGSLSAAVLLVLAVRSAGYLQNTITREHLHDAAKLMFGFTVFWAYIAFAQYFLIWYGNMPEETQFYLLRRNGAWYPLSIALPVVSFVIPFFLLMPRASKRNYRVLGLASGWILAAHAIDVYWQVLPVLHHDTIRLSYMDVAAPVALFGVVVLCAVRGYQTAALIPVRDARLAETIGYENETP